jgi:hypothetical protein
LVLLSETAASINPAPKVPAFFVTNRDAYPILASSQLNPSNQSTSILIPPGSEIRFDAEPPALVPLGADSSLAPKQDGDARNTNIGAGQEAAETASELSDSYTSDLDTLEYAESRRRTNPTSSTASLFSEVIHYSCI